MQSQSESNLKFDTDYHNPVVNPLPYNIQNPYIIRDIAMDNESTQQRGGEGVGQNSRESYFARQGNNMLHWYSSSRSKGECIYGTRMSIG